MRSMYRGRGEGGFGGGMMGLGGNWFDRVDANQDGKVTLDEMTKTVLGLFDRVDANHDGVITPEERQAVMRARMQQQPQQPPADRQ
jgi:Ca2+-binding EF-hand superfamily protein